MAGADTRRMSTTPVRTKLPFGVRLRRDWQMVVMMVPGVAFLLLFFYIPIFGNVIAFQDYLPFLGITGSEFVGLANFVELFDDPNFLDALRNTMVLAFFQLVLFFPIPLVLALMVDSLVGQKVKRTYQSIIYLPHFLSWVLVVALFQQSLGGAGLVNNLLRSAGLDAIPFMTNPDTFPLLATAQVIWKDAGWAMIIFLAALANVDVEQYEAAAADGAGRWRR
ncbi:MAG: ABC transporter permease subunit, partial [Propionibacteriales bacterium]|nr:ABC transporter permease subunit [Propionibacteriales bacterium]